MHLRTRLAVCGIVNLLACTACLAGDLSRAVVVAPAGLSGPEKKAVQMLVDEVHKRTQIRWQVVDRPPAAGQVTVAVGPSKLAAAFAGRFADALAKEPAPTAAEGFRIRSDAGGVVIAGNDARGVLFGIGYLLRHMHMNPGKVTLDEGINVTTAPKYPLRGHQLGY